MKRLSSYTCFSIVSLILLQISGCKKDHIEGIKQTSFNTSFDLQLSDKILVTSPERQIMVELRSINDSRCTTSPCETIGNAHIRVFLSDAGNHAEAETNLCIGDCDEDNKTSDTASIMIDGRKYRLILKNISGSSSKKAELQLNKD
jgi:hypothetical protein